MPRAIWNDTTLAESDDTVVVEGNHYFPADSLDRDRFRPSDRTSVCPWKGEASYYEAAPAPRHRRPLPRPPDAHQRDPHPHHAAPRRRGRRSPSQPYPDPVARDDQIRPGAATVVRDCPQGHPNPCGHPHCGACGAQLAGDATAATWSKGALTYVVPFAVSNVGILIATHRRRPIP
jgi:hypothetical protein